MGNKDLPMAVVMLVIFIILFALSFTFQSSGVLLTHTTAAFFPRVVLVVAMFLNLILLIQTIRNGPDGQEEKLADGEATRRVGLSMACSIAFGFGVVYLGTLVSMALFIGAIMLVWGCRNMNVILLNTLIAPIIVYLVFKKVLLVQLPAGILM